MKLNKYESIVVFRPDLPVEETDKIIAKFSNLITNEKGEIIKVDKWGAKKTAYPFKKYREGFFVYINYASSPELVNILRKNFLVTDGVLRSMTTKVRKPRRIVPKKEKVKIAPRAEGTQGGGISG